MSKTAQLQNKGAHCRRGGRTWWMKRSCGGTGGPPPGRGKDAPSSASTAMSHKEIWQRQAEKEKTDRKGEKVSALWALAHALRQGPQARAVPDSNLVVLARDGNDRGVGGVPLHRGDGLGVPFEGGASLGLATEQGVGQGRVSVGFA